MAYKAVKFNSHVAKKVREMVQAKVPVKKIVAYISEKYESAPRDLTLFYKVYGNTVAAARAEALETVGKKVYEQAIAEDFHFPSQELYLTTSEEGFKRKQEIDVGHAEEETSALDEIMGLLGKERKDSDET